MSYLSRPAFSPSSSTLSVNSTFSSITSDGGLSPSTAPSSPPSSYAGEFCADPRLRSATATSCPECYRSCKAVPRSNGDSSLLVGKKFPVQGVKRKMNEHLEFALQRLDRPLRIYGILATTDDGSELYAKSTAKDLQPLGVQYTLVKVPASFSEVASRISELNNDPTVDGLIFYTPCFGPELDREIRRRISPRIDVEGFHHSHVEEARHIPPPLLSDSDTVSPIYPCTPLAVVRALQQQSVYDASVPAGRRLAGKVITVINRSDTVGRPLAAMFAAESALVFSIDDRTTQIWERHTPLRTCECESDLSLDACLAISDIVVSAVPFEGYKVKTASLKTGVIALNVAAPMENFEADVMTRAAFYAARTGSLTIAMLVMNALALRGKSESAL